MKNKINHLQLKHYLTTALSVKICTETFFNNKLVIKKKKKLYHINNNYKNKKI